MNFNISGIVLFWFLLLAGGINARPAQIHLSWSGNKVKTFSTISVSWISDYHGQEYVKYGTNSKLFSTAKAKKSIFEDHSFAKVLLKNLKPATTYIYRCGSDQTGWSQDYTFTTAPTLGERKGFKVGVFGDTQNNTNNEQFEKTRQIINQLESLKINFTLHMGDVVNKGSILPDWINYLGISQPLNARIPMMLTLGNHDIENIQAENFQKPYSSFFQLFSLPGTGLDYSFDFDNVHFVCIFSGYAKVASKMGLLRYAQGSKELEWLKKDLSKAHKPWIDWIIVYTHYPFYSYGWSDAQWEETLPRIFEKYHVDMCVSGHRHVYERHFPLISGVRVPEGKGVVYITNGTAGGLPMGLGGEKLPSMVFTAKEKMYNYATMTFEGQKLTYEVFDQNSRKIDQLILNKKR